MFTIFVQTNIIIHNYNNHNDTFCTPTVFCNNQTLSLPLATSANLYTRISAKFTAYQSPHPISLPLPSPLVQSPAERTININHLPFRPVSLSPPQVRTDVYIVRLLWSPAARIISDRADRRSIGFSFAQCSECVYIYTGGFGLQRMRCAYR